MREIGSEFWNIPTTNKQNNIFPESTLWFISGTAALMHIIYDLKKIKPEAKTVALPSWCCECMIAPFLDNNYEVVFYDVYMNRNELTRDIDGLEYDIFYDMNYFGYSTLQTKGKINGIVIRDLTHSIFNKNQEQKADYYFGSLRKWAGFLTGGFAVKNGTWNIPTVSRACNQNYLELRKTAMAKKQKFIAKETDAKDYLEDYAKAEDYLDSYPYENAFSQDIEAAHHLDIAELKTRRQNNAKIINKHLSGYTVFKEATVDDCPLFVPILLAPEKRNEVRRELIKKSIYCPIHWPLSELHKISERAKILYSQELSLICDQRYTGEDVRKLTEIITQLI